MLKKLLRKEELPSRAPAPPLVSIIVIVYRMAEQAERTVRSLFTGYQHGVSDSEFEVIIVENESPEVMAPAFVADLPANFRYYLRRDAETSPGPAINFGAARARGENVCVMIDGARMVTPGVVRNLVLGHRLSPRAVVAVPGYHLGSELQQHAVGHGYNVEKERGLLRSINWPYDGYALFDIACFSGSNKGGLFLPNSESNCISVSRALWVELGGFDERFNMTGGGLINLDFYRRACSAQGILHVVCHGEGTFHQFHGGVTTGGQAPEIRESYIRASKDQYRQLRGGDYQCPDTEPVYLGEIPDNALHFLRHSADNRISLCAPASPCAKAADA